MAEENEAETGPEGIGAGPDAVALGAAMARASGAVDQELIAYLGDQRHHRTNSSSIWRSSTSSFTLGISPCLNP